MAAESYLLMEQRDYLGVVPSEAGGVLWAATGSVGGRPGLSQQA
jgi:hypothetical protein